MRSIPLSIALGCGILAGVAAAAARADSVSRSCQGFGDWTICVTATGPSASSGMSCRSINGRTLCTGPRGLRCEWEGGRRPTCSGGAGLEVEISAAGAAAAPSMRLGMPDTDEDEDD